VAPALPGLEADAGRQVALSKLRMIRTQRHAAGAQQTVTMGVTDLMTSLAIIFILLLTVYVKIHYEAQAQSQENKEDVKGLLRDHFDRFHLRLEDDPDDPLMLLIVVPENLLNFEFGKASLRPTAAQFLDEVMPFYAQALCGQLRHKIDSMVIEGHTDDRGDDALNLKLSQDRSFSVMVKGLEVIQAKQPVDYLCFQQLTSASGRGKQDLLYEGSELNRDKSRRVIFKIRLRSAEQRDQMSFR
jgi:outer membrane protein OmpA-like peptidoglycan-associated protein